MSAATVLSARFDELGVRTFHDIVRLRLDAFVVEQRCPYPELDGRDLLPTTRHLWIEEGGAVVAYLRLYPGADGSTWIGRVVTAADQRRQGLGALLMRTALETAPRPVRISAQTRLAEWYAGQGFVRSGNDFVEDGILHTPMVLEAVNSGLPAGR